jgi:Tfp pilus assembly protein PilO
MNTMRRTLNILIVLLILNLIGGGLLWLGYTQIEEGKQTKAALRQELLVENQKGDKLKSLRRTLSLAENDREAMERYLFDPSEENQIKFLSLLEELGLQTTGAAVVTSSFDVSNSDPRTVHTELAVSGSWKELYHLLRLIESLPTHVAVDRYTIMRKEAIGGVDLWQGGLAFGIMSVKLDSTK